MGVNLTGANLRGTIGPGGYYNLHLSYANLSHADFTYADLSYANFTNSNLSNTYFSGANLTGVIWANTTCSDGTNSDSDGGTCIGHLH